MASYAAGADGRDTVPSQVEVVITTQSQPMSWSDLPAPQAPKITLNGEPFPVPSGGIQFVSGYQVAVLNAFEDLTNPASIISNEYVYLASDDGAWSTTYPWLYENVALQVLSSGNPEAQVVFVVSFGLDLEAPPTNDAYEQLLARGAGPQLQDWEVSATDRGSMNGWVGNPANYILIGGSAFEYGGGSEAFGSGVTPLVTTATATFSNP